LNSIFNTLPKEILQAGAESVAQRFLETLVLISRHFPNIKVESETSGWGVAIIAIRSRRKGKRYCVFTKQRLNLK